MKVFLLTLLTLFFILLSLGQSVSVVANPLDSAGHYSIPIVKTGNPQVDSIINKKLITSVAGDEKEYDAFRVSGMTLLQWLEQDGVFTNIGFEVTYNTPNLLSMSMNYEGCGAYCSNSTAYFNFKTGTGEDVKLSHIVDTNLFLPLLREERKTQYRAYYNELEDYIIDEPSEESNIEWAKSSAQQFADLSFDVNRFVVTPTQIIIIDDFEPPHAIRCYSPIIELEFNLDEIQGMLKLTTVSINPAKE